MRRYRPIGPESVWTERTWRSSSTLRLSRRRPAGSPRRSCRRPRCRSPRRCGASSSPPSIEGRASGTTRAMPSAKAPMRRPVRTGARASPCSEPLGRAPSRRRPGPTARAGHALGQQQHQIADRRDQEPQPVGAALGQPRGHRVEGEQRQSGRGGAAEGHRRGRPPRRPDEHQTPPTSQPDARINGPGTRAGRCRRCPAGTGRRSAGRPAGRDQSGERLLPKARRPGLCSSSVTRPAPRWSAAGPAAPAAPPRPRPICTASRTAACRIHVARLDQRQQRTGRRQGGRPAHGQPAPARSSRTRFSPVGVVRVARPCVGQAPQLLHGGAARDGHGGPARLAEQPQPLRTLVQRAEHLARFPWPTSRCPGRRRRRRRCAAASWPPPWTCSSSRSPKNATSSPSFPRAACRTTPATGLAPSEWSITARVNHHQPGRVGRALARSREAVRAPRPAPSCRCR